MLKDGGEDKPNEEHSDEGDYAIAFDFALESMEKAISERENTREVMKVLRYIIINMYKKSEWKKKALSLELILKQLFIDLDTAYGYYVEKSKEQAEASDEVKHKVENELLKKELERVKNQHSHQLWTLKRSLQSLRTEKVI